MLQKCLTIITNSTKPAKGPPNNWGVSICTVEGQRLHYGHSKYPFSIQSCSKPLSYAFALEHFGPDVLSELGYQGWSPLHYACYGGKMENVTAMIKHYKENR